MISSIISSVMVGVLGKLGSSAKAGAVSWALQRSLRKAARELVLDEIENLLEEEFPGMSQKEIKKMRRSRERKVTKEVKARLDPIFKLVQMK